MNTKRWFTTVRVVGVLTLAACGSSSNGSSSGGLYGGGDSGTTAPPKAAAALTIGVKSTDARGDILVDGAGRTLYLFEKDSGTTSACTGGCVSVWPPLTSAAGVAGTGGVDPAKLGSAHDQVTYNGHLLYYFSGDTAAGDMKGVDIEGWYPVTPAGDSAEPK